MGVKCVWGPKNKEGRKRSAAWLSSPQIERRVNVEREHATDGDKKRLRDIPFIKGIPNNGFNGDNKDSVRHFFFSENCCVGK